MTAKTLLDYVYDLERTRGNELWMTQPMGGGQVKTFTFAEAIGEARKMAAYLEGLGHPPGSCIALCSKNTAWWIIADLAIWMAGHVTVPIFPTLTGETVRYILDHSEAKLLFVGKIDDWAPMSEGVPKGLPCVEMPLGPGTDHPQWDAVLAGVTPMHGHTERDPQSLATIVYTSGSTGQPKGVMLSFDAMRVSGEGFARALEVRPSDRMLSYLPLAHAFERAVLESVGLVVGFQIFFAESLDTFVQDLQRARPTLFISVPRLWLKFQSGVFKKMPPKKLDLFLRIPILSGIVKKKVLAGLGLDHVRAAGTGSAPTPPELIAWYRKLGLVLAEGYGMTENCSYSHVNPLGDEKVGSVGKNQAGVETRISDIGEIQIKSPANMMGYYKNPEATAEAFTPDGFLRTGDKGRLDGEGRLYITGRVKEIFKTSKGKYVAPAPIESELLVHPMIEQACVSGSGMPQPFAMVVLSEEGQKALHNGKKGDIEKEVDAHLAHVNAKLDPHEQLEFVTVVSEPWTIENGMLTPTMKLRRSTIEEHYGKKSEDWYGVHKHVVFEG